MKIPMFIKFVLVTLFTGVIFLIGDVLTGHTSNPTDILIVAFAMLWCNEKDKASV